MKRILFFMLSIPYFMISQVQIGQNLFGNLAQDNFGYTLSINETGNIIAVGVAPDVLSGYVKIFENLGNVWQQVGTDIVGEAELVRFGYIISLNGDGTIVAVRGDESFSSSFIRVYQNQQGTWSQIGNDIDDELEDGAAFSFKLSSSGAILVNGSPFSSPNGFNSGQTRVFQFQSDDWVQIGNSIDGLASQNRLGTAVDISDDGNIIAVGTTLDNGNGNNSGSVKIFQNISGVWTQLGNDIFGDAPLIEFGSDISLNSDGTIVAIGAPRFSDDEVFSGQVKVFRLNQGSWVQIGNDIYGAVNDRLGDIGQKINLSDDGSLLSLGIPNSDVNGVDSGIVKIYQNQMEQWVQIGVDINGDNVEDTFGSAVRLSGNGNVLISSAPSFDGNSMDNSGLVKVFRLNALLSSDDFVLTNFNFFPNPAKSQFTIQLNDSLSLQKVNIYNSLGQFLKSVERSIIDVSSFSSGLYYVEIITNKGKATKKLVIE